MELKSSNSHGIILQRAFLHHQTQLKSFFKYLAQSLSDFYQIAV